MANNLHISVAAEPLFKVGPFAVTNSILTTWIVMAILIAFAFWYNQQSKKENPGKLKVLADMVLEALYSFFHQVAGDKVKRFFPFLATFFLFILLQNWFGLLPGVGTIGINTVHNGETAFVPILRGGTADLNMTFALGIISVVGSQVFSIKFLGLKDHIKKYFSLNPINMFIGILEIVSELSRIISFSFRLFGNIFAGEVLLAVMLFLLPFVAPLPFVLLEVFVGFIQALVFTMLTLVFTTIATEHHGDHGDHEVAHHQSKDQDLENLNNNLAVS